MADQPLDGEAAEFDERELVDAARQGDQAAVAALYDHYLPRVFRFVMNRLESREDAEDVTAEVFIRVVDNLPRFAWRENVPFGAWVFRIARNEVVSHVRRRQSRPRTRPIDDAMPIAEARDDLEAVETASTLRQVRDAASHLSPAQRDVIELRFGAGLTVAETARVLKKSENNVKVLQHKAIANLKNLLSEDNA